MKRTIFALLLVLVLIFALVACGGGKEPDDSDTDVDSGTDTSTSKPNPQTCTHNYGEWQVVLPANCLKNGMETRQCSICDYRDSRTIVSTGHNEVIDEAVPATCTTDGLTEGSHCSVCKKVFVAQAKVSKDTAHLYTEYKSTISNPNFTTEGQAKFKCELCGNEGIKNFDKLTPHILTKNDIYSIEFSNEYNPAKDNGYKLFDGSTNTAGIFATGSDWFGYVGDKIIVTFKQEMLVKDITVYVAGNETFGKVTAYGANGGKSSFNVTASECSYGGAGQAVTLFSNKAYYIYKIEIEVTGIKWDDYRTFKVSEVKVNGAPRYADLPHDHDYREEVEVTKEATCAARGEVDRACWCGKTQGYYTPRVDHKYNTLDKDKCVAVTCTENGKNVYKCQWCTSTIEEEVVAKGHIYAKLVECTVTPTQSSQGKGTFKCVGCNLTEEKVMSALEIEEIQHLRISQIDTSTVTLKLNIYGSMPSFEVKYSSSEITSSNFESAISITPAISGSREISLTLPLTVGNNCYYVAVRPYVGTNYGEIKTIRVGGAGKEIPIEYENAFVYSGEVLNSFAPLFDNDVTTKLNKIFNQSTADDYDSTNLQGTKLSPIIDLEYMHYVSEIKLYYDAETAGKLVTARWSDTPVDFLAEDSAWDGTKVAGASQGWITINISAKVRFIQLIFTDGESPCEVEVYGYQCGEGDKISTTTNILPTIGDLIGMCGFVASGGGNTPIDSVICTTVLREYHNFGWSYRAKDYGKAASFFTGSWMGDFDAQYLSYRNAGINVIPCIQWQIGNKETISYKVDASGNPVRQNGELVRATFWERFDPNTYFVYADNVFAFAARYGSNSSSELLSIAVQQVGNDNASVGQDTIQWIELGNEPDGSWNGINHYSSAYQLAAATSAAYDGHCATMKQQLSAGYHLGGKNADPNMKFALAGVSGISNEYMMAICYWQKANRPDGKTAFDAFNVHNYMSKAIEIDGYTVYVGMSPEEANLKGTLSQLVAIRDKYYPEKEVWITEFGWDTNQSYATVNSSHAYGDYTGRQVQAMWLTRAYLLLSSMGIDKATMYMCEDTGVEAEAVGKFGSSGVIGYEYDAGGNVIEVKKDSYYYLYTLKNTLGDYTFYREIEAYDENVMIYEYKNNQGKSAYAVWCKTSDGTVAENYQLMIDGDSATLVENVYGDMDGKQTSISADEYSYVTINVTENPAYVVVK